MQFLVSNWDSKTGNFEISGREARHLALVLRKKPGDKITLFDGNGAVLYGTINETAPGRISGTAVAIPPENRGIEPPFDLYPSLIKGSRWESLLEKACEMGAASITPLMARRCVVQISEADFHSKESRWRKILESAAKQCNSANIPELRPPIALKRGLSSSPTGTVPFFHLQLMPWENPSAEPIWETARSWPKKIERVSIFTGPEGGWDPQEVEEARFAGVQLIGLGPQVLRAETAVIAALAMTRVLIAQNF